MEKSNENKFVIFILCISPLFALISNTGSFSVQSILPLIILLVVNFFMKGNLILKFDRTQKILLLLIGIILISTAINSIRHNSVATIDNLIEFLYMCAIYVWFYLNTTNKISKSSLKKVLKYYNIASLVMSIQIIIMSLKGIHGKIMVTNFANYLMDENYVTALITMTPIYCFVDLLYEKNSFMNKLMNLLFIFICSTGVALAGSRAALIALILGLCFTLLYYFKDKLSIKKILIITLIMILGIVFIFNLKNIMPEWIYNRYFNSNYMDNSNTQRILIWKNALKGLENQPILGFGMGTFANLDYYEYTAGKSTPAHQTILDMGLYGGIIGMIIFIIFILSIFIPILKNKKAQKYIGILIGLTFISMIVSATKTVFLWNNLIYLKLIVDNIDNLKEEERIAK